MRGAKPSGPFFVDTNVLVYAFSSQDPRKRELSRTLLETDRACISTQVLSELANVLTKRFAVRAEEARRRILEIAEGCDVMPVTPAIVADGLRIMESAGYSFFDSQIIAAALAAGARTLYSEDLHTGQIIDGTLQIMSPFASLARQRPPGYAARPAMKKSGTKKSRGRTPAS